MTEQDKREKVIKGLETSLSIGVCGKCVNECWYGDTIASCHDIIQDALALLKAQEPVKPVLDIDTWTCGKCGHTLEHQELIGENVLFHEQYNYCPECGKKVKWDE